MKKLVIKIVLLSNFENYSSGTYWLVLINVILYELKCSYPSVGEDLIIARIKKTQRARKQETEFQQVITQKEWVSKYVLELYPFADLLLM